jgi:hypothetical protein
MNLSGLRPFWIVFATAAALGTSVPAIGWSSTLYGELASGGSYSYVEPLANVTIGALNQRFGGAAFVGSDATTQYALEYGSNDLYAIDTQSAATQLYGQTGISETRTSLRWDPSTSTLFALGAAENCSETTVYAVDVVSAGSFAIGSTPGVCVIAAAVAADGVPYGIEYNTASLVTVNKQTGTVTTIGALGIQLAEDAAFDIDPSNGVATLFEFSTSMFYTVDLATGAVTPLQIKLAAVIASAIAYAPASGSDEIFADGFEAATQPR